MQRRKVVRTPPARCHPGRKALAYHEAGHAVVGYVLGLEIERLDITPDDRSLGHCFYGGWEGDAGDADLALSLPLLLAGPIAEEIAMGVPSAAADERKALRLARSCCATEEEAVAQVAGVRRLIEGVLERHWPAVKAVVKVLRKHRELDGSQTMGTLSRAFRAAGLRSPLKLPRPAA